MGNIYRHDVAIIGTGASGLTLALKLPKSSNIGIFCKGPIKESSTLYAQGGIAAVMDSRDSVQSHIQDTLSVGQGLCDESAVEYCVSQGRPLIEWLIKEGVSFTQVDDAGGYHLTREGGHSHRRVIHAADATGREVETTLVGHLYHQPHIHRYEHVTAVDLIIEHKHDTAKRRCIGFYVYDNQQKTVHVVLAKTVILATGGASKVYLYTSNPDVASGDGIAMAWRAGCRVANMEFNQFHPTCLYHPKAKTLLLTEAIRGEGGLLKLPNGERFMSAYDTRAELAPRDIVARAIDSEMKKLGVAHLYLDISHKPADFITSHFPNLYERCLEYGIDMTKEPMPIVPAAHYTCGGVMTGLTGQTDIPGLYAVGETAHTGLHGANRMASNSLLECLVFANAAAIDIEKNQLDNTLPDSVPAWDESQVIDSDEAVVISHNWEELRRFMWDYVGIVRSNKRLQRAKRRIALLKHEIEEYYSHFKVSRDFLELRNLVIVAELIINCAEQRHESRGLHYNVDYPTTANKPTNTILTPSL